MKLPGSKESEGLQPLGYIGGMRVRVLRKSQSKRRAQSIQRSRSTSQLAFFLRGAKSQNVRLSIGRMIFKKVFVWK
jgi:hypothetical protein